MGYILGLTISVVETTGLIRNAKTMTVIDSSFDSPDSGSTSYGNIEAEGLQKGGVGELSGVFDEGAGFGYFPARSLWLGRCSELIYPVSEAEKAADKKVRQALSAQRSAQKSVLPWRKKMGPGEIESTVFAAQAAMHHAAQTEASRIGDAMKEQGFAQFQFFSGLSTQCFIAANDQTIILCFRGTQADKPRDIFDDLKAVPMRHPAIPGWVHRGFCTALDQVWDHNAKTSLIFPKDDAQAHSGLVECLHAFRHDASGCDSHPQKVWITGHSLGGALAVMAAARLIGEGILAPADIGGVYTFGQPRVGDGRFQRQYPLGERHFRVVNSNDIVTRLPPESIRGLMGVVQAFIDNAPDFRPPSWIRFNLLYEHVGRVVFISTAARAELDVPPWPLLQLRTKARIASLFCGQSLISRCFPGVSDHGMALYNARLEASLFGADIRSSGKVSIKPGAWLGNLCLPIAMVSGFVTGLSTTFFDLAMVDHIAMGLITGLILMLGFENRYLTRRIALSIGHFGFFGTLGVISGYYVRTGFPGVF